MLININDKLWTPTVRKDIIKKAAEKYEAAKRRVRTFDKTPEKCLVIDIEDGVGSDSDDDTDNEESESDSSEKLTHGFIDFLFCIVGLNKKT